MTRAAPARFDAGSQHRRALIGKVHVAKTQLGLNDDDYRAVLLKVGGAASAKDLSDAKLILVVQHFEARGFNAKARKPGTPRPADHPIARKARALWISLHQLGAIDNPSEAALEAFACRQLGVAKFQWADQGKGYKLIEALKAMATRAGWSQAVAPMASDAKLIVLKRRLVDALMGQLWQAGLAPLAWDVDRAAWEFGGIDEDGPLMIAAGVEDLDRVARTFAAKLHAFRNAGGDRA